MILYFRSGKGPRPRRAWRLYGEDVAQGAVIPIEYPPNRALATLIPVRRFESGGRLRKSPRLIAQEIAHAWTHRGRHASRPRPTVISMSFSIAAFLLQRLESSNGRPASRRRRYYHRRTTAINPNKAAHIGHLRNSALGDTLVLCSGFPRDRVEIQNYIDDTGVKSRRRRRFRELEGVDLADVQRIADSTRFDFIVGISTPA